MSVKVGQPAPEVSCEALLDGEFKAIQLSDYQGKWVFLYFYPLDFTFVCPTEIIAFNDAVDKFAELNCDLLACSTDSVYSHLGWCGSHPGLKHMKHAMLGDTTHEVSRAFDVLLEDKGIALRGSFVIDPEGVVRWINVNDLSVGRSVDEALRVLQALQTDELTPCGWKPGQATLAAG